MINIGFNRSKIEKGFWIFLKKIMEAKPVLLCIPDISGFTRFMADIDFELSSKVVPSLLNNIIYSNEINLNISEIEGDAVLFYRSGRLPSLKVLVDQSIYFYTEFYRQIGILRERNLGRSGAESIPEILGLKIILHHGKEVGLVPIGTNIKLMGEDVIIAHRLLKNNIPLDEYILISEELLAHFDDAGHEELFHWSRLTSDSITVDHLGAVNFKYVDLSPLQPS